MYHKLEDALPLLARILNDDECLTMDEQALARHITAKCALAQYINTLESQCVTVTNIGCDVVLMAYDGTVVHIQWQFVPDDDEDENAEIVNIPTISLTISIEQC